MTEPRLSGVRGVLLDLDGVLTVSGRALEGAQATVDRLRASDTPFRVLTNTTSMTRRDLLAQTRAAGLHLEDDQLMTAAMATAAYLRQHHAGASCFLITKTDLSEDFEGIEISDRTADVVVIGGAEEGFTYDKLNKAFQMLMEGGKLLAMHRGMYWKTDEGLKLDAGAFVGGLEAAAGVEATLVGKPARAFFDAAVDALDMPREGIVMVGDSLRSDVNGAQAVGLRGVLVRTGAFRQEDLEKADREPDAIIDSIADLPELIST